MSGKTRIILIVSLLYASFSGAQTFEKISVNTDFNNTQARLIMADLDNDGNPEFIQSGTSSFSIFKNTNGTFDMRTDYPAFKYNNHIMSIDAGDMDRDGWIDILQAAQNYDGYPLPSAHLVLNKGTHLEASGNSFLQSFATSGKLFFGDFEGDGDLDILSSGISGILLNEKNTLNYGPNFPTYGTWYANWWDLDHDSQLEVIQVHGSPGSGYVSGTRFLERNFPRLSVSTQFTFGGVQLSDADMADYDSDGDLDMLLNQPDGSGNKVRIYKNQNGSFVDSGISFPWGESIAFGDINNDGLYDVIISGLMTPTWYVFETAIYLNQNNNTFTLLNAQIPSFEYGRASIGDFDSDGDLDIASLNGMYKNLSMVSNLAPLPPAVNSSIITGSSAELSWQAGTDDRTPVQSLSYNIAVRSEDGTIIVPGHSLPSGKRQIYKMGNAFNNLSFKLSCLKQGTYYWKVQTLDAGFQGSEFSTEQSFTIIAEPPVAPANLIATPLSDVGIKLNWVDQSTTEDSFIIFRKHINSAFGFSAIDTVMANETQYIDTFYLEPGTSYIYEVVASNCAYPYEFMAEASATTFPPVFENSGWLELGETEGSVVELGDFDNDEDLDLLLTYSGSATTKLFRFDGNAYVDSGIQLPLAYGARWIDYNNDGFIDLLLSIGNFYSPIIVIYKNEAGISFSQVTGGSFFPLSIQWQSGLSLGDYDQDGDEDLLVQSGTTIQIYDNNSKGRFTRNANINLTGNLKSSGAWADYDRDGDLDILASREVSCTSNILVVFENRSDKTFVPVEFPGLQGTNDDYLNFTGDMEWGDYDNDGYPDILVAGQNTCSNGDGINRIYHNNGNKTFTLASNLTRLIYDVNVDWGDYDNDGDLDVFAFGNPRGVYSYQTKIYRNDGNTFNETNIDYLQQSLQGGKAARGDIDHDGDLDYVILGEIDYVNPRIVVYKNQYADGWGKPNHAPSTPTSPMSDIQDQSVILSWSPSHDDETVQAGLTYNIYLMDETDSVFVNSYSLANGNRKITAIGNVKSGTSMKIVNLKPGTYRWAVQSVDKGFKGSVFSEEGSFVIDAVDPIDPIDPIDPPIDVVTGTEEDSGRLRFSVFPNPTTGHLKVTLGEMKNDMQLVISSSIGEQVMKKSIYQPEIDIDMSALPDGLYVVTIFGDGVKLGVQKILKK